MPCPNCNVSEIPENARFCPQCGAALTVPQTQNSWLVSRAMAIALGLLVLLIAAAIFWEAGPWHRYIALVPPPRDLGQQASTLHDKLEGYERSADTLKTLVTFMISLSTLYALALALNAYIGVQEATKRAEQSVKSLNDLQQSAKLRYDRDLMDIRREFPLFREMQSRIGDIRDALLHLIPEGGFGEEAFKHISPTDKVKITHYERTVASFEFFNLAPFREEASRIYQLLGSFHSHKWLLEKESGVRRDETDKDWARFYLLRSNELKRNDVATLNELGFFELKVTAEWDLARKHLSASRDLDARQQRPRYFLSICEHYAGDLERRKGNAEAAKKHYGESVELLTTALGMKRWQQEDQEARVRHADFFKRMICYLHYNRACAQARLAEFESVPALQSGLREKAVADLNGAFPSGTIPQHGEQLARDFQQDTNAGGDLFSLVQSQWGSEVKQLIERVNGV
jgi:hypothetical protein